MVQVALSAVVKVAGGPTWALASTLVPESYTVASVQLDAAGGAPTEDEVPLLPDTGTVALLVLRAHTATGADAEVTVVLSNGGAAGDELTVAGTLLVANSGVLAGLVNGGPRSLTVRNASATAVTVDILTGLDPA